MTNLRIPGPTPCPPEVLQAMSRQMINHRGPEFAELIADVTRKLKEVIPTKNDVLLLTASGTGGLEAAIVNTLSPGDKVLAISIGVFGDRFANIARTYGAEVILYQAEWGKACDPDSIRKLLDANPDVRAILITHNETSTGVTNPLKEISSVVSSYDKLLLVDAISSLGSIELPVDEWHLDVTITGSQKGWMVPPGMAMVIVSEKAWQANSRAKMPRFYWDLTKAKSNLENGQTPWTPAISIVFALQLALDMMLEEGMPNVYARHARVAQRAREGLRKLGIPLFSDPNHSSNTVTAARAPEGLDVKKLLQILRTEHDIVLSGGQQHLSGKIFRIGHLGWVTEQNIDQVIDALTIALPQAGLRRQ